MANTKQGRRTRKAYFAAGAAAACLLAAPTLADASNQAYRPLGGNARISGISFAGSASTDPVLTITGTGFGVQPTGTPVSNGECGYGTGYNYGNYQLWVADATATNGNPAPQPWAAGQSGDGDCVGLIISSWSNDQIVVTFGSRYGTGSGDHWVMKDADALMVMVNGNMQFIDVPAGF